MEQSRQFKPGKNLISLESAESRFRHDFEVPKHRSTGHSKRTGAGFNVKLEEQESTNSWVSWLEVRGKGRQSRKHQF